MARASSCGRDALLLTPVANDPILAFDPIEGSYNFVRIEMATARSGQLQVFWSPGDTPFGPERRKTIQVQGSDLFSTYDVDLSSELGPKPAGLRFRIDPIDHRAEVRIRAVTFSRALRQPEGTESVKAGKLKIGGEVRATLALRAPTRFATTLRAGDGATKRWVSYVKRDPEVRLGIAGKIYPVRLEPLAGGEEREAVVHAYAQKYKRPLLPPDERPEILYFRVMPRG